MSHRGSPADTDTTGEAPVSDTGSFMLGMENSNGSSNLKYLAYKERQLQLPLKSSMQCTFQSDDSSIGGSEGFPMANAGQVHHQRTSSDSLLLEEPPYWLEELLDEPETPMCRGHRRSSSDSIAFMDRAAKPFREDGYKFKDSPAEPSMGSSNFNNQKDLSHFSYYANPNTSDAHQKRVWGSPFTSISCPNSHLSTSNAISLKKSVSSSSIPQDCHGGQFKATIKRDGADLEGSSIRSDSSHPSPSESWADSKRAKQQFAQKSRIRKLQYIAELERNVQALQVEGYEVSAELEFLDQQNLILGMENVALKQRLESLSQEQFIKCMEQDMLRREISRLRYLYRQQQQQETHKHSTGGRTKTRDLDSQFVSNSIKPKEAGSC